jgi:hypothetical protein
MSIIVLILGRKLHVPLPCQGVARVTLEIRPECQPILVRFVCHAHVMILGKSLLPIEVFQINTQPVRILIGQQGQTIIAQPELAL